MGRPLKWVFLGLVQLWPSQSKSTISPGSSGKRGRDWLFIEQSSHPAKALHTERLDDLPKVMRPARWDGGGRIVTQEMWFQGPGY